VRKGVFVVSVLALFSTLAEAQIAFDSAASGEVINGTSVSYSHAVTGTSALLVVGVYTQTGNDVVYAPTYNGTALTLIDKVFFAGMVPRWVYQYALANAPQGPHTLTVTTSSAVDFAVVSASYMGVDGLPADNWTKKWEAVNQTVSSTTTLTPNTNNTWTILVGATAGGQPIGAGSGSTLRVSSGDTLTGWPSADRLGIFDSNGPISPAAATSMTITGSSPYTEFGTVMASYARAETTAGPLPKVYSHSLTYVGGFRVPYKCFVGSTEHLGFGGGSIAFSPTGNFGAGSLFIANRALKVAEITIPEPLVRTTASALNEASCLQDFVEPTEGVKAQAGDAHPTGMAVVDGKLWINNGIYYDAGATQILSAMSRPLNLSTTGQVKGLYGLTSSWSEFQPSMATQSIAEISSDWTTAMGGNLFVSKFNRPIITSQSYGPNAIVTKTDTLIGPAQSRYPAEATPLFYPGSHSLSGDNGGVLGQVYTTFSQAHDSGSLVQPKGTSSLLVFQVAGATRGTSNGGYGFGYGCGCATPVAAGSPTCGGQTCPHENGWFYDPERPFSAGSFATHGYPYVYQVVAYDMNDLVAVNNGEKLPWEPRPYDGGVWEFTFPISAAGAPVPGRTLLSNATYDSAANRIYIAQVDCCDWYGLDLKPIIHVFQVNP
jgi:hypothetical protein